MYKRLSAELKGTRRSLTEICDEMGIDYDEVEFDKLLVGQCSHCNTWSDRLIPDLDDNPICRFCVDLVGM